MQIGSSQSLETQFRGSTALLSSFFDPGTGPEPSGFTAPPESRPALTREQAEVDDVFQAISDGYWSIFRQIEAPVPYLASLLSAPEAVGFVEPPSAKSPETWQMDCWKKLTDKGKNFVTGVDANGANCYITYDITKKNPFRFYVTRDDLKNLKPFFTALGLTGILNPRGATPQRVNMNLEDWAKLSVADWSPIYNSENGGASEPAVDPELTQLIKDTGIDFNYTFQFIPDTHTGGDYVAGDIHVLSTVTLPVDYFKWWNGTLHDPVSAQSATNRFPYTFAWDWARRTCTAYSGFDPWPESWSTPGQIKQRLDTFTRDVPGFQPRVNQNGWTILPDGELFKPAGTLGQPMPQRHAELAIARERASDPLFAQLAQLQRQDPVTDEVQEQIDTLRDQLRDVARQYAGRISTVDWINDKMVRWTNEGRQEVIDLIGARALDPTTEFLTLNTVIDDPKIITSIRDLVARTQRFLQDAYDNDQRSPQGPTGITEPLDLGRAVSYIYSAGIKLYVKHLCGVDLDEVSDDDSGNDDGPTLARYCSVIHDEVVRAWKIQPGGVLAKNNELTQCSTIAWLNEMVATTTPDSYAALRVNATTATTRNAGKVEIPPEGLSVPNIELRPGEFDSLMPHQVDTLSSLMNFPDAALLDISAGGGKTALFIIWVLKQLEAGLIRRPLVVTAGNLVPGFITEVNSLTNGKVNVVPLRMEVIRSMIARLKMQGVGDLITWVKRFPSNTLFVCAYTDYTSTDYLFTDWWVPVSYGAYAEKTYPYRQIMAACGFQFVGVDESQFIKNRTASRSLGVGYMLSRADKRGLGSGTMVNNVVLDIHGQVGAAVNGRVFGTQEQFEGKYRLVKGNLTRPTDAVALARDMRQHCMRIIKKKSDWAFLLPDLHPEFVFCEMTQNQTDYYNRMMTELMIEIRRELEKIREANPGATQEELEARIESMLDHRLQAVEQFLVGPDLNRDFTHPEGDTPQPDVASLTSPEVEAADKVIDKHLAAGRKDKIIVFGYHKVASAHFMRHSRHAKMCIRYTAGNLGAITRFKDPKGPFILVADENSMKQGHNLQIAGHVIRLQAVWAPGDYEQAISRMFRPDPRGIYNRQHIEHTWIIPLTAGGGATLGLAKSCRMISKAISNAQYNYAENPDWAQIAEQFDVPMLSMNLNLVFEFQREDADQYLKAWNQLSAFENAQMAKVRARVGSQLEKKHNVKLLDDEGRVLNIADFVKYAMVPMREAAPIAGSRRVHTPWVEDAQPADPYHLDLELVTTSTDNIAAFREGQLVMTEYGPGQVIKIRMSTKTDEPSSARVQTAVGVVNMPLGQIAVPAISTETALNVQRATQLKMMFNNLSTYALVPEGMSLDPAVFGPRAGNATTPAPLAEPPAPGTPGAQTPADQTPAEDEQNEPLDLLAGVVNGMPTLYTRDPVEWLADTHDNWGWVTPYIAVTFKTWKGASAFIDELNQQFWLTPQVKQRLAFGLQSFKAGQSLRASVMPNVQTIKNFFWESHRRLGEKDGYPNAKPYWMTLGHTPMLVFNVEAHSANALRWLSTNARKVPGVLHVARYDGLWVNFCNTPESCQAVAKTVVSWCQSHKIVVDVPALNKALSDTQHIIQTMHRNAQTQRGAQQR